MNKVKNIAMGLFSLVSVALVSCETEKLGEGVVESTAKATPFLGFSDGTRNITNDVKAVLKKNGTLEITAKIKNKSQNYKITTFKINLHGPLETGNVYPWKGGDESVGAKTVSEASILYPTSGLYSTDKLPLPSTIKGRTTLEKIDSKNQLISGKFFYTLQAAGNAVSVISEGAFYYVPYEKE